MGDSLFPGAAAIDGRESGAADEPVAGYVRVAVERGLDRYPEGLTYAVPESLGDLAPGERVVVPLGRGNTPTAAYVISAVDDRLPAVDSTWEPKGETRPPRIKFIIRRDESAVRLPAGLIALARWIASYYCAPIGVTLASMLPAAVKRRTGQVMRTLIDLGDPLPLDEKLPAKQKAVLEALANLPAQHRPVEIKRLAELAGLKTIGPIRRLLKRGLVESKRKTSVEAVWAEHAADAFMPEALTPAQQRVVDEIAAQMSGAGDAASGTSFSVHLLYGVTGSGKTEVYIRLIEQVLAQGRSALVLVPEISLTPQTGGRLIGRFPDHRVAVLHSGLTAAQRHQQWMMVADGRAHIVLGARSAVFAPIPDGKLGMIIVDEEHDSSYKQDQAPRYHGRDVAIRRGQLAGCPVILGSATPSLESWYNAGERFPSSPASGVRGGGSSGTAPAVRSRDERSDSEPAHSFPHALTPTLSPGQGGSGKPRYILHRLPERVPGARLPHVRIVDFVQEMRQHRDRRVHLIGPTLLHVLRETLDGGDQALILLNRRGYANYIACPDHFCGWVMQCDDCDATMVYHVNRTLPDPKKGGYVRCHHCLAEQKLPAACPQCDNRISTFGLGTQRVEEELCANLPHLVEGRTLLRVDSDAMHGARDFHSVLERFGAGEVRVLVGTQMIAKGLDYPGVRLVGVINADTSINLPDFRAGERTFQLVSQVAGRSGRGVQPGRVIVQTFSPDAPAIRLAAEHDYEGFARLELAQRRQSMLPPITRMTRIVVRDKDLAKCITMARRLVEGLRPIVHADIHLRGPAPCPIARIAGRHRQQIEIIAHSAGQMQSLLAAARSAGLIKPGAAMAVDVDPIALL